MSTKIQAEHKRRGQQLWAGVPGKFSGVGGFIRWGDLTHRTSSKRTVLVCRRSLFAAGRTDGITTEPEAFDPCSDSACKGLNEDWSYSREQAAPEISVIFFSVMGWKQCKLWSRSDAEEEAEHHWTVLSELQLFFWRIELISLPRLGETSTFLE